MVSVPKEPVPPELERLVDEIDGWMELRCADKVLELVGPLIDHPEARTMGLVQRIRALVHAKRLDEALRDLAELRTRTTSLDWVDLTEAWCRKRSQDLAGAIRCMRQLLDRNPKSAIGHFNFGCYLALAGERERALDEVTVGCGLDETLRELLADEPDLKSLRRDERFAQLLATPTPTGSATIDAIDDEVLGGFADDDFADAGDELDDPDFVDDDDDEDEDEDEDEDDR